MLTNQTELNLLEKRTIIKGFYLIISPLPNDKTSIQYFSAVINQFLGNSFTQVDICYARDNMTYQTMISNIDKMSINGKLIFKSIILALKDKIKKNESDNYCDELINIIDNYNTGLSNSIHINTLLNTENQNLKQAKLVWIIIGFALAPLGGIVGLWIGTKYASGKYNRLTKFLGYLMIIISLISIRIIIGK